MSSLQAHLSNGGCSWFLQKPSHCSQIVASKRTVEQWCLLSQTWTVVCGLPTHKATADYIESQNTSMPYSHPARFPLSSAIFIVVRPSGTEAFAAASTKHTELIQEINGGCILQSCLVSPNVPKQFKVSANANVSSALKGTLQSITFYPGLTAMAPSSNIVRSDVGEINIAPSEGSCARRQPRQLLVNLNHNGNPEWSLLPVPSS